jgi:hypothetical protein
MTLAEAAGLAGVSAAYMSMLERGLRPLDRRSTISALAVALRVSETEITGGPHLGDDAKQSGPHTAIAVVRVALLSNVLGDAVVETARPLPDLARSVSETVESLRRACDYVAIGELLPGLIDELHYHLATSSGQAARQLALQALIEACVNASLMAKHLGYLDLAHIATLRAEEAARLLGDPAATGKAAFLRLHTGSRDLRSWDRTLAAAERAANMLEPHACTIEALSVLGLIALSAALAAAVLQRGAVTEHWLAESAELAERVPDDMASNWQSFSPTNVAIWRTSLAVERGEGGRTVTELAKAVDERRITSRSRRAAFLIDVGRGLAREPRARAEAVDWLRTAEDVGPQYVRNCAPARETVAYLLDRATATAGGRELRGMAARMGVSH